MQLASTSTPRSAINSVTCSYDSGYRRYKRTHKMINSPGCCRPLKGLVDVIGIDFYPASMPTPAFATKPAVALGSPARKLDARLPAQRQYRETCGFDRVLIATIRPSS